MNCKSGIDEQKKARLGTSTKSRHVSIKEGNFQVVLIYTFKKTFIRVVNIYKKYM